MSLKFLQSPALALDFIYETVKNLIDDEGYRIAAEASFYLIFSIFPLVFLIFVALGQASILFDSSNVYHQLNALLSAHVPEVTLETLTKTFNEMLRQYQNKDFILASILFIWPASNIFYAYSDAVSVAYGIPNNRSYFRSRLLSIGLLFGSGFIIFVTSLLFSLFPLLYRILVQYLSVELPLTLIQVVRYLGSFLLITPCIAMIYRFSPDTNSTDQLLIWPGTFFATTLWILFSQLFGLYLKYIDTYQALYGALGAAMLLLLWMYLASLAVVFGAEFNFTMMNRSA